eukprot:CAMPEP_0176047600 /NCGR_PEP_ID=MMETSP0120_2-20121206/23641_1 /TAXON_ID=160619 /ORGANISM="Kryptoperidinium foliaceum, Strain CCMP 1326" /LENGTH=83 /DNA_ID=CAMNT_0017381015 /DNA_START=608 /DNA_END=860 /DNA_ORIENTATION=-
MPVMTLVASLLLDKGRDAVLETGGIGRINVATASFTAGASGGGDERRTKGLAPATSPTMVMRKATAALFMAAGGCGVVCDPSL